MKLSPRFGPGRSTVFVKNWDVIASASRAAARPCQHVAQCGSAVALQRGPSDPLSGPRRAQSDRSG